MRKIILIISLLSLSSHLEADLFGGDVGVLIQLAATSIKQLNELEQLVSSAEKYTEKVQEYNEVIQDKILFANQVLFKLERLKRLKRDDIKDLASLNQRIRDLKWRISDFKKIFARAEIDIETALEVKESTYELDRQALVYKKISDQQKSLTRSLSKNVSINKSNALTNAYGLEIAGLQLQVSNQNLFQNATQTEYMVKSYEESKLKEHENLEFWLGNTSTQEVNHGAY